MIITSDGRVGSELNRRIGAAFAVFRQLQKLWKHSSVSKDRKLTLFNAIDVPKLLYSLCTVWLSAAERRRLDGAQARTLRHICGIKHSMISRVSNEEVRERACQRLLTDILLDQQIALLERAIRRPAGDPLRDAIFCPGSLRFVTDKYVRKIGAPRHEWARRLCPILRQRCPELFQR